MKNILVLIDDVKSASAIAHYALQIAVATQANLLFGHAAKISAPSQCINNKEAGSLIRYSKDK